jgi:tetraacyldisaccharide 4'-kinase
MDGHPLATAAPSSASRFLRLIRGEESGLWPAFARLGLWLASLVYGLVIRLRNLAYYLGLFRTTRATVPVISVGNLTTGGTGKTPCVEYVADLLRDEGHMVAILSRGYGAAAGPNDEALVLEQNLPDVPHLQGPDRVALAQTAVEELESEALVLDDGFQHRRLARDLDLVLIDATDPWGTGHLLPRGLMREPAFSLSRAHAVLLTRCDQAHADTITELHQTINRLAPGRPVAETTHGPVELINAGGETKPLTDLQARPVAAFCGLGNPDAFRRSLESLGASIAGFRDYPDHHPYSREDVASLGQWGRSFPDGTWLLTTQKDLVKLRVNDLGGRPLWALRIRLMFRAGQEQIDALIRGVMNNPSRQGGQQ